MAAICCCRFRFGGCAVVVVSFGRSALGAGASQRGGTLPASVWDFSELVAGAMRNCVSWSRSAPALLVSTQTLGFVVSCRYAVASRIRRSVAEEFDCLSMRRIVSGLLGSAMGRPPAPSLLSRRVGSGVEGGALCSERSASSYGCGWVAGWSEA